MNLIEAVLLGILQGLTEFLPISSSGHLVLAGSALGVTMPGALFEVAVHMGTLLAILLHYRRDLVRMVSSVVRLRRDEDSRTFLLILLASLPAAAVGILFREDISALFDRPLIAGALLVATGLILLSTRLAGRPTGEPGPAAAIGIGLAQALAILPGISRSGATIAAGMHAGVAPAKAARFSFLLAVPALIGAAALSGANLAAHPPDRAVTLACGVGAVTAFLSGYLALRWLLGVVSRGRLDRFAWYCLAVGCGAVLYFSFL